MKKWALILIFLITIPAFNVVYNKTYYPPLPTDSLSKREVVSKIEQASEKIVKFAEDNQFDWYISRMEQGNAYEHLKHMLTEKGWQFIDQMGAGFIFEKDGKQLIAETEMWTGKYVICQIPKHWRE